MANAASQQRTRAILREIVNACANEIAATHSDSEPSTEDGTSGDDDDAVEHEQMQEFSEEVAARDGDEHEQRTSSKRKIEQAIDNLRTTYFNMEKKKLKFRRLEEDLADARHRETMQIQKDMCNLIGNAITDAVTKGLEPRGA